MPSNELNKKHKQKQCNAMQAQEAIKNECKAPTLPYLIKYFQEEKSAIETELGLMPPDAWLNVRGRALANREQELHVTLNVLQELVSAPVQITEPTH